MFVADLKETYKRITRKLVDSEYLLPVSYGLLLMVVIWCSIGIIITDDYRNAVREIVRDNDQLTRSLEEHVRSSLFSVDAKLQLIKAEYERDGMTPAVSTVLQSVKDNPLLLQSLVIEKTGKSAGSTLPGADQFNYADRSYFKDHQHNKSSVLFISEPIVGKVTGKPCIYLSRRIEGANGSFGGVVAFAVDPEYFSRFYRSMALAQGRLVRIVGRDGIVRASWNQRMDEQGQDVRQGTLFAALQNSPEGHYQSAGIHYGVDRFFSYRAMADFPLIVQVGFETEAALAEYRYRRQVFIVIALIGCLVVASFMAGAIYREMRKKKTECELRRSEALNRTILQTTGDGYWIVDSTGRMADVNEAYLRMSGYQREEFIGLPIYAVDADEVPAETAARIERIFQNGSERFEVRHRRKDGSVFDVEVSATLLQGVKPLFVCFCRDITERKSSIQELLRMKQAAEESEARFKALHNASFGGIAIHDKGVILDTNQGLADLTGYSSTELIGMDGLGLIAPEDRQLVMNHIVAGYEKPYEAVGLRKNGEKYPIRLEGRRIPYQGNFVRVVEFRDISDQKEAELLIRKAQECMQIVFDGINALIYIADIKSHELLFINEYGKKLWGEGAAGNKCWQFLQHLDGPCSFCTNDKIVNVDGTPSGIYRWEFKNLVTGIWYDVTDCALRWVDGRLVRLEIAIDITERKQAEEAQRRNTLIQSALREIAEAASAAISLEEMYATVNRLTNKVLPSDIFHLALLDETNTHIVDGYSRDVENYVAKRRPVAKGLTEYTLRRGRALHVTADELQRLQESGEVIRQSSSPIHEWMGAPMITPSGKWLGVLAVISRTAAHSFQPEEVEVLAIIAAQVSMAIERKQAAAEIRASQVRYQAFMEQSYEAQAVIDIKTQEIVEINRRVTELFGYSLPEDAPLYAKQVAKEPLENTNARYATLNTQRFLPPATMTFRHKNGAAVLVERAGTVITLDGRDYLLVSMRDMTIERRREAELARDVGLASRVQRELLPALPASPRVAISSLYYPWHAVSRDSYQMEWRNEGTLLRGFLIDMSGHGLATALQTASISVLLRENTRTSTSLLEQVQRVNAKAAKYFAEESYATLLGFELDLLRRELRYVGAGITKFYINGREIMTSGMFIGMFENVEFGSGVIPVEAGDCLYFLTDGFTDLLAQPDNANFWSPDGKDFEADVAALERLAESGMLRDDATGLCFKIMDVMRQEKEAPVALG